MLIRVENASECINNGGYDEAFRKLYANATTQAVRGRYADAVISFEKLYGGEREIIILSAPGRTEIGGNHTDHQRGRVLAAAVDLDIVCVASKNDLGTIRVTSEGYLQDETELDSPDPREHEKGKSASLTRGVSAWLKNHGYMTGGMDIYMTSAIPAGSGLSSSAAYEIAIGSLHSHLYNSGKIPPSQIARAGQHAENNYFGKPSGLMDQIACAAGGFVYIDFQNPDEPAIKPIEFDFASSGFTLCIVDTKGSHADLTSAYAAIPAEMRAVAALFGKEYLSEVDETGFYQDIKKARAIAGDRAILRAMHFFAENERVQRQAAALQNSKLDEFLQLVNESGESSQNCLQNIFARPEEQSLSIALAISKHILKNRSGTVRSTGACRVHGGGFAGTIQAYIPNSLLLEYRSEIERIFGQNTCHALSIRPLGAYEVGGVQRALY